MSGFKKPNFVDRQNTAAKAKKAALEKFRASAADPAFEERLGARIAGAAKRSAARNVRETGWRPVRAVDPVMAHNVVQERRSDFSCGS